MRKNLFLMLALCILSAASVHAQVRIGGTTDPHQSTVLDLNASDATTGSTLGLGLPRVSLNGLTSEDAQLNGATPVNGTLVYNTNASVGGFTGLYVWDGSQWTFIASPAYSPITTVQVEIDTDNAEADTYVLDPVFGIDTIDRKMAVPLKIISTGGSSTDGFGWSVAGTAVKVTPDGTVTGNYNGGITVRATSPNGVFGEKRLIVRNSGKVVNQQIGQNYYDTYDFNGIVWMVENLKEVPSGAALGTDYKTTFNGDGTTDPNCNGGAADPNPGSRGFYYLYATAATACPTGWRLPTNSEWNNMRNYANVNDKELSIALLQPKAGAYDKNSNSWLDWGSRTYVWLSGSYTYAPIYPTEVGPLLGTDRERYFMSVRCVSAD